MTIWTRRNWLTLAGVFGLLSVAVGAFAAHGAQPKAAELLHTAATYAFMHAMATFGAAVLMQLGGARARLAPAWFLGGTVLFSGSLIALAFGAPRLVGLITPFGGLSFLIGWAVLIWAARGVDRN
jgi:uncharacterized membrane protein YgdD (TMEM256/DUF423 family)